MPVGSWTQARRRRRLRIGHRDAEVPEAEIGKNRFDRIQVDFVHEHVDVGGNAYLGRVVDELAKRGALQQDRPQTRWRIPVSRTHVRWSLARLNPASSKRSVSPRVVTFLSVASETPDYA